MENETTDQKPQAKKYASHCDTVCKENQFSMNTINIYE